MATTPTTARRQLRAIVFDLDDTLLDHHGAACQALDACTDGSATVSAFVTAV